jgi:hypothetical protein
MPRLSAAEAYRRISEGFAALAALEEARAREPAPDPAADVWTSRSLPADIRTRERFAKICATIPEAYQQGRVWVCPRSAWSAARTRKRGVAAPAPVLSEADALAERSLAAAGYRTRTRAA